MEILSILDNNISYQNKKVLVRLDLNVPIKNGIITDNTRIVRALPSIEYLLSKGAIIILASHLGRPHGQRVDSLSLEPIARAMGDALNTQVKFINQAVGEEVNTISQSLVAGDVLMLENLRFYPEEENNDNNFAASLASIVDYYVNDSFSCSHRAHASVDAITRYLPSFAGINLLQEVEALSTVFSSSKKPSAALVGGAKVSTKINVLINLVNKVDYLILGGGMANTFLLADGHKIGSSLCEKDMLETVEKIKLSAKKSGCTIFLPVDAMVADSFNSPETAQECTFTDISDSQIILDIGSKSINNLSLLLQKTKILLWNGPLGVFEQKPFDIGTNVVAKEAASLCKKGSLEVIAGGGDTISALNNAGVLKDMSYISTAGGAFLEWIEGRKLPGILALERK